jgi:transposase InsO family protein
LHLAVTTVSRFIKDKDIPDSQDQVIAKYEKKHIVTAKYPNHLWHVDMTVTPTAVGFWVSWVPGSVFQAWPFCWWFVLVIDHYSRRCMGFAIFKSVPTSLQVRQFLERAIKQAGSAPKHLVCDQGKQFTDKNFKSWCIRRLGRKPRYGAVGEHGSIAVIERFIRTLKDRYLRKILIPYDAKQMRSEMTVFIQWYNRHRPHETLDGATPIERYEGSTPANQSPRHEPRCKWPGKSSCAKPIVPVKGRPGVKLELVISFMDDHGKLPVVELRKAA